MAASDLLPSELIEQRDAALAHQRLLIEFLDCLYVELFVNPNENSPLQKNHQNEKNLFTVLFSGNLPQFIAA